MTLPHSIIYGLQRMELDGLVAPPYDVAGFSFSHSHGQRTYPYANGSAFEWMGLDSMQLQFTLYFLNTLEKNLFPAKWNDWRVKLFDGTPKVLKHPILGPKLVVVRSGDVQLTAQTISGIIARVTFATAIRDPAEVQEDKPLQINVSDAAKKADAAAKAANIPVPPEAPKPSLLDMIKAVDGLIFLAKNQVFGLIDQVKHVIDTMIGFIDRNRPDHLAGEARDALVNLWNGLSDLSKTIGVQVARKVAEEIVANDTTLEAFAAAHGNTTEEAIELNLNALVAPVVEKGSVLRYYTGGVSIGASANLPGNVGVTPKTLGL
jgi:prophage DNA circulation protein